jgi:hypothetical protein
VPCETGVGAVLGAERRPDREPVAESFGQHDTGRVDARGDDDALGDGEPGGRGPVEQRGLGGHAAGGCAARADDDHLGRVHGIGGDRAWGYDPQVRGRRTHGATARPQAISAIRAA